MAIKNKYQTQGVGSVASYDYFDIASGTGTVIFYAGVNGSGQGVLSKHAFYSDSILTLAAVAGNTYVKYIDIDFDAVLNRPLRLKGIAYFNTPFTGGGALGAGNTISMYSICKIRKWDGVTETDITSATSGTLNLTNVPIYSYDHERMGFSQVNVPITHYKKGETLRITVEVWAKVTGGASRVQLGHDPLGRNPPVSGVPHDWVAGDETALTMGIPTVVDI